MASSNGLCLSSICRDRSEAMGFGNHMHGVSEINPCGVVFFAAEVAFCVFAAVQQWNHFAFKVRY